MRHGSSHRDQAIRTTSLTISRRDGETVRVNGPATIEIVRSRGGRSKLRVTAESDVKILRGELVGTPPRPKAA